MKPEPHHEIAALLRTQQPDPEPSPGLEARILRELDRRQQRKPARIWPWLVFPPAFAALVLVLTQQRPELKETEVADLPVKIEEEKAENLLVEQNPLRQESVALGRDARRAGRFLIDCLPFAGAAER
ncbi:hypothetical protein [Luteolibacter sp. Populi]|uniref:hypothetical protein n=1 Tax=Luteolibacter sp. Populi TaxID=3230487 RepID=UPI0034657CCF